MPKAPVFTDSQILEALVTQNTVQAAADSLKCSKRTIYSRLQNPDFRACLTAYRAERIRNAAAALDAATIEAVEALTEILHNPDASPAERIKAAGIILEQSPRFETRLAGLESHTANAAQRLDIDDMWTANDIWKDLDSPLNDEI